MKGPTWYGRETWRQQKVIRSSDVLNIGDAEVMQRWETPLMHRMADRAVELCGKALPTVLEIGWGMGISGRRLMEHTPTYRVIEAHPEVARDARKCGAEVTEAFWQEVVETFADGSFDIVFFDPFPLYKREAGNEYRDFLEVAARLLGAGGVFTFYSGKADTLPEDMLRQLLALFETVDLSVVRGLEPPPRNQYWNHPTMVVPCCVKGPRPTQ